MDAAGTEGRKRGRRHRDVEGGEANATKHGNRDRRRGDRLALTSSLFTAASPGSPPSFLALFFSLKSIRNHHPVYYTLVYTHTHTRDDKIHET